MATNNLLLSTLRQCSGHTILVADENCLDFPFTSLDSATRVISNRFDVADCASKAGVETRFCDYDFSELLPNSVDNIVYRLSKEKAVVHHIANQAAGLLKEGGNLWLLGGKQEGIKTFAKTIAKLLSSSPQISKEGQNYLVKIGKNAPPTAALDDKNYSDLREIFTLNEKPVVSKPGLFGWNKSDVGSALLADHLVTLLQTTDKPRRSLLDLGCGYGYLSLRAHLLAPFSITATDNCAAAIIACRENFRIHDVMGSVIADDCAAHIDDKFDIVLCNPPFHQGFQQERKLTEKFLSNTRRVLHRNGRALFVVNQFVPLETLAREFFGSISVTGNAQGFKLVQLAP